MATYYRGDGQEKVIPKGRPDESDSMSSVRTPASRTVSAREDGHLVGAWGL